MCRRMGSTSTATANTDFSTPSAKYARMRARCGGEYYGRSATCTYRRVHCCMRVAHSAHAVLIPRLMNQSALTRTAEAVGWKAVASGRVSTEGEGVPLLARAASCCEI